LVRLAAGPSQEACRRAGPSPQGDARRGPGGAGNQVVGRAGRPLGGRRPRPLRAPPASHSPQARAPFRGVAAFFAVRRFAMAKRLQAADDRDLWAAIILAGMLASGDTSLKPNAGETPDKFRRRFAKAAWDWADALDKERT